MRLFTCCALSRYDSVLCARLRARRTLCRLRRHAVGAPRSSARSVPRSHTQPQLSLSAARTLAAGTTTVCSTSTCSIAFVFLDAESDMSRVWMERGEQGENFPLSLYVVAVVAACTSKVTPSRPARPQCRNASVTKRISDTVDPLLDQSLSLLSIVHKTINRIANSTAIQPDSI
jgi:hypothetical protein